MLRFVTPRSTFQITALLLAACSGVTPSALGQSALTANIVTLDDPTARPAAAIVDVAWIAGHWRGEALGGTAEEVWSPPLGGTMMGMYRLLNGESVRFYELLTIVEEAGSLILRLKHFNPDLTGWEAQDETVEFRLVRLTANEAYFDGMTFRRSDEDRLHVFVASHRNDGSVHELEFPYRRVR
jgi:hypothetical protein